MNIIMEKNNYGDIYVFLTIQNDFFCVCNVMYLTILIKFVIIVLYNFVSFSCLYIVLLCLYLM